MDAEIDLQTVQLGIRLDFFIFSLIGIVINLLVLVILIPKLIKGKAHTDIKICMIVACIDLCAALGTLFRAIFTFIPYNILEAHPNWCIYDMVATSQLLMFSGFTLGVMSVERFLLVCFNVQLPFYFWLMLISLNIIPECCLVITCAATNLFTITKLKMYCAVVPKGVGYATMMLATVSFYISFASVVISYLGIMIFKYRQYLNQINLNIPKQQVYKECASTLTKSIINMGLYIFVFSGKIYCLAFEVSTGKSRTIIMDAVSSCLIASSMTVNAITLLYMNQTIREEFFKLLSNLKAKIS